MDAPRIRHSLLRGLAWVGLSLAIAGIVYSQNTRRPFADGLFYLSALHSLYVDGDVDLRNEAAHHDWLEYYSRERPLPSGLLRNPHPIGPSLLWAPFYAASDLWQRANGGPGMTAEVGPDHRPATFGTVFWISLGLFVLADALRRLGVSRGPRRAAVSMALLATPLPAYITFAPVMGHGCAFAATSVFLWTLAWCHEDRAEALRWAACGLALGVAFSVRWQDALLVAAPLSLLVSLPRASLARRGRCLAWLGLGGLVGSLPQLLYWKALYGSFVTMPQGGGFLSFEHADPIAFLFSTWNGVFLCHPVWLFALAGFALPGALWRDGPAGLRRGLAAVIAAELFVCMLVVDWWSGGAFGQRRLISMIPLLALGLASLLDEARTRFAPFRRDAVFAVLGVVTAWNILSLERLHEGALPYNPIDPDFYPSGEIYEHYDVGRRTADILFGRKIPR
ncbi:MAG: hypothetical protein ACE5FL_04945 [Myxococcota bacterium]